MSQLSLGNFETFIKVAELQSIARSAQMLDTTQEVVLNRIESLETVYRAPLIVRHEKACELTEAGRMLLPVAKHIHTEIDSVKSALATARSNPRSNPRSNMPSKKGSTVGGILRIGLTKDTAARHLVPSIRKYTATNPDVQFSVRVLTPGQLLSSTAAGEIDVALCSVDQQLTAAYKENLHCVEIRRYPLFAVVDRKSNRFANSRLTLNELLTLPATLLATGTHARQAVDQQLLQHACTCQPLHITDVDTYAAMKTMLAAGSCWACMPESEIDDSIVALKVEDFNPVAGLSLVRRRDIAPSPAISAFIESFLGDLGSSPAAAELH